MIDLVPYSWLQKRAEMYSSVSESGFSDLKKVDFHFDDPEAGWVNMTISLDGVAGCGRNIFVGRVGP